jgi:hypothetical protein
MEVIEMFCAVCGKPLKKGQKKCCSLSCAAILSNRGIGENAKNWKGGEVKNSNGYILVYTPSHPYATKQGYVYKHRLVMEEHLGIILTHTMVVHHINGNRADNRIGNLMLFPDQSSHMLYHNQARKAS